ncbi:hypothetical protein Sango_2106000 [Sesamum angolense]|uniref:Reverse transcriptase domain-containing protein n=1 Tax=Sesamum angolense TaxID=2727404 RepID=A0AAE1WBN3_9LAMI|nr:hypothetical protein Sango_2106000 [Sesamum angolense]
MYSLTMKMERVSYARILVEVDASKKLVDHVEFILPNGVARKQPIIYEFTPKFCSTCNRFGHLKESCQPSATPIATATATATRNANDVVVKAVAPKKAQPTEWTVVQHRRRNNLKQQQPAEVVRQLDATPVTGSGKQSQTAEQQPISAAVPMIRRPAVVETDLKKEHVGETFGIGAAVEYAVAYTRNPVGCKLDRVLLNNDWLEAGLHYRAHFNLLGYLSDHSPGIVSIFDNPTPKPKSFRFFNMWADHLNFIPTVEERWRLNVEGTPQFRLCRKLKALKSSLKAFNNLHCGHISVRAKKADLALQNTQIHLESNPGDTAVRDSLGDLRKNATFLVEAERNAARNSILAITKDDGSIITSAPDIVQEYIDFYTSLLVTPTEVKAAVFHISDNKAPGPDGYTSCFFKNAWNIVGDLVCRVVMDFFRSRRMLRQLNHTIIALVPKYGHSSSVAYYRPIPCCNVICKVITKIIADRLSPSLEHLIDSSQVAFVGGRNITDNIFLAQVFVRQYSRKRKAFDSVSWTFLSRVLHGGIECSIHGLFPGKKGLRQGDSMSQALFLLCMEYFSRLIKRNTFNSDFNFHPKCEKLKITHLLFADDLMLFRDVSGLAIITSKSSIVTAGI